MSINDAKSSRRLLVIGMDGFEQTIANGLITAGRMPHLQRMLREGASVAVDHGEAKRTGLAWEHFATGLTPEGANRWSAVKFDPQTYECLQFPTQLQPFPAQLPVRTVVFDPPYFDLKRADNVRGLVCWGAHDPGTAQYCNPSSLSQEVEARFGTYPAEEFIYGYTWASEKRSQKMAQELVRATELRAEIAEWLLRDRLPDWDLGIVVVSELHSAAEALWHGVDQQHPLHDLPSAAPSERGLEGVYEALDSMLGRLQSAFPDCDLLLFSLHGMGANDSDVASMSLLSEFLYRRHFTSPLLVVRNEDPAALVQVGEDESWSAHVRAQMRHPEPTTWQRMKHKFRHAKRTRFHNSAAHALDWMPAAWYAPYWREMPAFAIPSFYDGQIRINVKGREANGLVAASEYDGLCQTIAMELEACINPRTGQSVVREVIFTHPGDPFALHKTQADLIVLWQGAPLAFKPPNADVIGPIAYRRPGGHTGGDGCALWVGGGFLPGLRGRRSAFDVVPTLVDYFGKSDPTVWDGQSFLSLITKPN